MLEPLKEIVCQANLDLVKHGLVTLTWGNVSAVSDDRKLCVIKPSGVPYDEMRAEHMVVVDLDGKVVEGKLRPSSDTPTHVHLYKHFAGIGGISHTHSRYATTFAQARAEIPCFGTTHADHFSGPIPLTRPLSKKEVDEAYELNTGVVIVERFAKLEAKAMPGVLVAGHGPFAWGKDAPESVKNAVALEAVAAMALGVLQIKSDAVLLEQYVLDKHYFRKHGPGAYYGQKENR
jgi:L-ribulose-5-phosphate 4-epimerase